MKPRNECTHDVLRFGSGDYYIFCSDCGGKWAAMSYSQSEYGTGKYGNPVGANSSVCVYPYAFIAGPQDRVKR